MRIVACLFLILLLSCNNRKEFDLKNLGNNIIIEGWNKSDFRINKVKLYMYDSNFKKLKDSIEVLNILNHHTPNNPEIENSVILLKEELTTENDYNN